MHTHTTLGGVELLTNSVGPAGSVMNSGLSSPSLRLWPKSRVSHTSRGSQACLLTLFLPFFSSDPVPAGEVVKVRVDLFPTEVGLHKLVVNFQCDKLKSVKGYRNVIIGPA